MFKTTDFRVKRLNKKTRIAKLKTRGINEPCNITCSSLIIARLLKAIKLQLIFKVCNLSYLHVLFHSSYLLLSFWYINHTEIKGKECIHVTLSFYC